MTTSAGKKFRDAVQEEVPLQIVGAVNAFSAIMAKDVGFGALYLSGAGVANVSYGLPDLGMTTLDNVLEDTRRITAAVDLPLLVDIDTGFGGALMIQRAVKELERAGAAGVHIEDQIFQKKCGHLPDKSIVAVEEMVQRIKAAVSAKTDPSFVIMARSDALACEGLEGMLLRIKAYKLAGADMLFPEAVTELDDYAKIKQAAQIPILANMTEFGKTELFHTEQLKSSGVDMVLYPLSATRAMMRAAFEVFRTIRLEGSQKSVVPLMQTRDDLYQFLRYKEFEEKIKGEGV